MPKRPLQLETELRSIFRNRPPNALRNRDPIDSQRDLTPAGVAPRKRIVDKF